MQPSFTVGMAAIIRIFMPGLAIFIFSCPLLLPIYERLNLMPFINAQDGTVSAVDVALITILSFLFGIVPALLDDAIYKVYEGLRIWPRWLRNTLQLRSDNKVKRLYRAAEAVRQTDKAKYDSLWARMRNFPLDENGIPYARLPTKLGNIIYAYEDYPKSRYQMDSVFYLPRLWTVIDEYSKKEFRTIEANSEAPLYVSFSSGLFGVIYVLLGLVMLVVNPSTGLLRIDAVISFQWGFGGVVLSIMSYYACLPLHRIRGEHFKALFDGFGRELKPRMKVLDITFNSDRKNWEEIWAYLQYRKVICSECARGFPAYLKECPLCRDPIESYKREIVRYEKEVNGAFLDGP